MSAVGALGRVLRDPDFKAVLALGVLAELVFLVAPGIDIAVARWFYLRPSIFVMTEDPVGMFFDREVHRGMNAVLIGLVVVFLASLALRRPLLGLTRRRMLFLTLVFVIGPGLIVNVVLKDHWGRARPSHVVELGGTKRFTPPFVISDQCDHNCSFSNGDESLAVGFLAFAMLARRRRAFWYAVIGSFAAIVGLMRMARGAHFLSDTIFSALIVLAVIIACRRLVLDGDRAVERGRGEPHTATA